MSNLVLNPKWNTSINQVENGELISGGADGNANLATKQLAENVWFLKDKVENDLATKADKSDVYTKTEADGRYSQKSTTLNGYGITDAYTKSEIDKNYGGVKSLYDKNVEAGAGENGWTDLLIRTAMGRTQRDKNAEYITINDLKTATDTNDTAIAKTSKNVVLPYNVHKFENLPKNVTGLVKVKNRVEDLEPIKYPLQNTNSHAIDATGNHCGLNSHVFVNPTTNEWTVIYRSASYHGVCASQMLKRTSKDNGLTWSNAETAYLRSGLDVRCSVSIQEDNLCIVAMIVRNPIDNAYQDARAIVSEDYGKTWTSYSIPNPGGSTPMNFHGNLVRFGNKIIAYSYANGGNIDAFYTTDGGKTWSYQSNVISKTSEIPSLSETTVVKVNGNGIAIIRTGVAYSAVAKATDNTGLNWTSPILSSMPMGTNPYSGIIDGDNAWILFCDRKANSGIIQDDGALFALKLDQALIDRNFTDFEFYFIRDTPDYSVTHAFAFKDAWGRWCATYNAGERNGTSASLYCLSYAKPVSLNKVSVLEAKNNRNLLIDGGFNLTRISQLGQTYTGNYRNKYFSDGWLFSHANAGQVTFSIVPNNKQRFNCDLIESNNYLHITSSLTQITSGSLLLISRMPLGTLGFRQAVTVSFWARSHGNGGETITAASQRYLPSQAVSDTNSLVTAQTLTTYWKRYVGVAYILSGYEVKQADIDAGTAYDALNLVVTPNASGEINVDIADVKIEFGERATAFEYRTAKLLAEANRFYYVSSPTLNNAAGSIRKKHYANGTFVDTIEFRQSMYKTPSVNIYSPNSGLASKIYNATSAADVSVAITDVTKERAVFTSASIATVSDLQYHYVLDARL